MRLKVIGCGEAFGSGGRYNTSFYVETAGYRFLLDCGATTLVGLRHFGIDPMRIQAVLITHMHGDHFGGLPFLDRYFHSQSRQEPLVVVGPTGLETAFTAALDALFPGSSEKPRKYPLNLRTYQSCEPMQLGPLTVTGFPVDHDPLTHPHALRIEANRKVLAFSGDTAWCDVLKDVARDADLFICECQSVKEPKAKHIGLETLQQQALEAKRIVLTHMGDEMLAHPTSFEKLEDGLELTL